MKRNDQHPLRSSTFMTPLTTLFLALVMLALSLPAQAQNSYRAVRASEIIGMSVRDAQGNDVGEIDDMIVDMTTGRVRYAVLAFETSVLQADRLFAVPTQRLHIAAGRNEVVVDVKEARLEQAAVARSEWDLDGPIDRSWIGRIDDLWSVPQPDRSTRAQRLSNLLGKDVNTRAGEDIGDVEGIVVNLAAQRVHYTVLSFDGPWTAPEQNHVFPLGALDLTEQRNQLVLDADPSKLKPTKTFTEERYVSLNDRTWVASVDRRLARVTPTLAAPRASRLFTQLDNNRDGSLDTAEAQAAADIQSEWQRLDANADGRVTRQEFTQNYPQGAGR
jgi:sporulation protein YlmC with PRC-barrel domain